eukprot:4628737-Prymnesium_polylepis.1
MEITLKVRGSGHTEDTHVSHTCAHKAPFRFVELELVPGKGYGLIGAQPRRASLNTIACFQPRTQPNTHGCAPHRDCRS